MTYPPTRMLSLTRSCDVAAVTACGLAVGSFDNFGNHRTMTAVVQTIFDGRRAMSMSQELVVVINDRQVRLCPARLL